MGKHGRRAQEHTIPASWLGRQGDLHGDRLMRGHALSFRPSIRRLGAADLHLLRELNALFGDAFEDVDTYAAEPPDDAYLTELLAKEHVAVLVAVAGEEVLGGLI